jgi:hypothetical protein
VLAGLALLGFAIVRGNEGEEEVMKKQMRESAGNTNFLRLIFFTHILLKPSFADGHPVRCWRQS